MRFQSLRRLRRIHQCSHPKKFSRGNNLKEQPNKLHAASKILLKREKLLGQSPRLLRKINLKKKYSNCRLKANSLSLKLINHQSQSSPKFQKFQNKKKSKNLWLKSMQRNLQLKLR